MLDAESRVRLLSGKRTAGFSDGDAIYAMFNRPRSFALDSNDNVYVADRINHVIRKISGFSGKILISWMESGCSFLLYFLFFPCVLDFSF